MNTYYYYMVKSCFRNSVICYTCFSHALNVSVHDISTRYKTDTSQDDFERKFRYSSKAIQWLKIAQSETEFSTGPVPRVDGIPSAALVKSSLIAGLRPRKELEEGRFFTFAVRRASSQTEAEGTDLYFK